MTTVSERLEASIGGTAAKGGPGEPRPVHPGTRASVAATLRDSKSLSRAVGAARSVGRTVATDVAQAWPWAGTPPTLADLWAARIPDLERVPGNNEALRVAWAAFNLVALALTAPGYAALWVMAHPARFLLAVFLTVPVLLMWI